MNSQIDASIPVLTEIIPLDLDDSMPVSQEPAAITETITNTTLGHPSSTEEWQQMEQNLHEAVLHQVLSRIDFVLEHRVRDSLTDVLQTSVERLAGEIRSGLHKTLEEIVTRAITQEISKIKSSPVGNGNGNGNGNG
jgi:hypothetical protein